MKITTICATVMSATVYALTSSTLAGGGALAWGANSSGQTTVPNTANSNVTAITGGYLHTLAIKNSGVLAWGSNDYGQTSVPNAASSGVTNIAAGKYHSLALTGGSLVAWGFNYYGQCTFPTSTPNSSISAIAAGTFHSLIVRNGAVFAWGSNDNFQCNPTSGTGSGVTSVAGGYAHSAALKAGAVLAWGNNDYGQTSVPNAATTGITAIACGSIHTIALDHIGNVIAWGDNYYGQCLGTNSFGAAITTAETGTAVKINGVTLTGVTAIAGGDKHTVALKNGAVLAWGYTTLGQCTIPAAATSGVTAIGAGENHTVAVGVVIVDPCDVDGNGTPNANEPGAATSTWLFPNITSTFENPTNWSAGIPGYNTAAKITGNPQITFGCDNSVKTLELSTNSTDSSPGMSLNLNSHTLTVFGGQMQFNPGAGTYMPYSVNINGGFIYTSPTGGFPLRFESDHATWNINGTQLYSPSTELATIASSQIDVKLNNSTLNTAAITRGDLTDGSRHIELLNSSIHDFYSGLTFGDGISLSLGSIMAGENDYAQNSIVSYGVSGAVFQPGSLLDAWGNLSFVGSASFGGQLDLHAFSSTSHGQSNITVQGSSFNYGAGSSASAFAVMNVYGNNFNQPPCSPPLCADEGLITLQLNYNGLASIGGPLFIHNTDGSIPAEGNLYTLISLDPTYQGAFDPNNNKFSTVRWVGQPLQNGLTFEQVLSSDKLQLQCVRAPNVEPAPTTTTNLANVPFASASGDFTNDGRDDVVNLILGSSNSVQIMKDMGDGTFTQLSTFTLPAGDTPNAIAVGNATGDAALEIAVTSVQNGVGFVGLYSATGTQIWKNQLGYNQLPTCVCILNPYTINGTSLQGQVVLGTDNSGGNGTNANMFFISGGLTNVSGNGTSSQNTPLIGVPRTVSGADIDPDDAPDVTTSGNAPAAFTGSSLGFIQQVKYQANGAQVGTPLMLSYVPVSIAIADIDGDGVKDICAACNSIASEIPASTRPVACFSRGSISPASGVFTMSPPTGISVGLPVQGKAVALVQRNGGFSLAVASTSTDGLNDSVDVIELNTFANGSLSIGNQTQISTGGNVIGLHTLLDQGTQKFATVRNVTGFTSSAVIESTGLIEHIYGDFDGSGIVDNGDVGYMLLSFGEAGITDLDGSGTTDSGDLGILFQLFN